LSYENTTGFKDYRSVNLKTIMKASPTKVIQYFNSQQQYLIPLFQRSYTWEKSNWEALWNDLMVQYDSDQPCAHFMGAIVSIPADITTVGVNKFLVIDGQQRLTTISLLLCALRDCLKEKALTRSAARIQEVYLTNHYCEPSDTLKLIPTQADRDVYRSIALDEKSPAQKSLMGDAYEFFKAKLNNGTDENDDAVVLEKVLATLEQSLQVVAIDLDNADDPYLIFESLNFKGQSLTQADLVRNYILMRFRHSASSGGEQEEIYFKYWKPLEESLGDRLTEFLRHYLMKDGSDIKQGGIYTAMKSNLKVIETPAAVEKTVESMQRFGEFYATILNPEKEATKHIRSRLASIQSLTVTTSYPLLLRFLDARDTQQINEIELEKCLGLIESYLVRRAVCKVPTNTLNKLFIQWAKGFPKENHHEWLHNCMMAGTGNRRFPRNAEFKEAFVNQPQYGRDSTRFILCRLERSFGNKEVVDLGNATIEHVLPQSLTPQWHQELGDNYKDVHGTLLHTFGNLTLTAYNSELGNSPFADKRVKLEHSNIDLNRWICKQSSWRATEIKQRAEDLFEKASGLWAESLN
jgi:uncharacterized protein with ParB-like and HNH nuclease domain